jgi:ubiquinone/menaquinone biosynthesis C-methylase UbiE
MSGRAAVLRHLLREKGLLWLIAFAAAEVLRRLTRGMDRRVEALERRRGIGGFFSAETQRVVWDAYDWARDGEEWTQSEEWKRSVVAELLRPHVGQGCDVLEIGPGAGRWSVELQPAARTLTLVDVSRAGIERCRARLQGAPNVEFIVNDGRSIPCDAGRFHRVWSFDVFVHIGADDTARYLAELRRVLRPGGLALIHHTADGGIRGRWRSHMTAEQFASLARGAGLSVSRQFDTWRHEGREFGVSGSGDAITILEKSS